MNMLWLCRGALVGSVLLFVHLILAVSGAHQQTAPDGV
jgi:hypothetical protein